MKKSIKIFAALCALAAVSCDKENSFEPQVPSATDGELCSIEARTDGSAVKSVLTRDDEGLLILWEAGDAISVFDGAENKQFTTEDEGAEAVFNYYGTLSKEVSFYALYPYDENATISGNVISTTIPTSQAAVAESFAHGANLSVGYTTFGKMVTFRNALAYAKVGFKSEAGAKIKKIVFRSLDENILLSGKVSMDVTVSDGEVSAITATVTDGVPYAEVVAPEGEYLQADTYYYLTIAPAALASGYKVEFVDEDGMVLEKAYEGTDAVLARNHVAPVGKKNIDNIDVTAWYRVHNANLAEANHPGAGNYLVVKKMDDGSYRVIDQEGTDTYLVKPGETGATDYNTFQLSGSSMAFDNAYKRKQMEAIVAYVFRNAWVSSTDETSGIAIATDEVITGNLNCGIEVKSYVSERKTYYYANVTLYNRTDNLQTIVTLDKLACSLTSDEGYISGRFNTMSSGTNPDGNPNTCSDLVDALMLHAGSFSGFRSLVVSAAKEAIQNGNGDNQFTAGGWSSKVYSNAYTPMGSKMNYSNHFMIKTQDLLSGATTSPVTLYKKETKKYSEYLAIK